MKLGINTTKTNEQIGTQAALITVQIMKGANTMQGSAKFEQVFPIVLEKLLNE